MYGPAGTVVATVQGNQSIEFKLPATGVYTLRASEASNTTTEEYRIGLERLFPASPTANPLPWDATLGGLAIDPAPDQDFYLFQGYQGSLVNITLTDVTGGWCHFFSEHCPIARLFGPDQSLVASLLGTVSQDINLPLTGTYTVRVYDEYLSTEFYNLSLACVLPPAGSNVCGTDSSLINISTRGRVGTGDNVMIGGFVISGTAPKRVLIRALGPSLSAAGVPGALFNPTIQLTRVDGTPVLPIGINDNWQDNPNWLEIQGLGFAPGHPNEAALLVTLEPNIAYTPIVSGVGGTTGVALVEVYEVDGSATGSRLINLSTRMHVGLGENVLIGGFVIGGNVPKKVVIRGLGPSLTASGVAGALANPTMQLTQVDGTPVANNDDWKTNPNAPEIQTLGFAPTQDAEAVLLLTLPPGPYTPIISGVGGSTGVGQVEVYEVLP